MEVEVLKYFIEGGVGVVAVVALFLIYRNDRKQSQAIASEMLERYISILKGNMEITGKATAAMEKHAEALKGMADLLKVMFDSMQRGSQ